MRVKALVDHINDYGSGPGVAVGDERSKKKGAEYDIPDEAEAKQLIASEIVEEVKRKG